MPTAKSRGELSREAVALGQSFDCVYHKGLTYIPTDYETGDDSVTPPPERTAWVPFTRQSIATKARAQFDTLFQTENELASFEFMVSQCARVEEKQSDSLLVATSNGLKELKEDGLLHEITGEFVANTLPVKLNDNADDKAEMFSILSEWLRSDEEATALLRHLATGLAPGWSAVRYVLLLGDGRNGKSVLLSMLETLFGRANCSGVTRQEISTASPVVTELRGKLVNIVFDGQGVYLKDSGMEKTLIAGEPVGIRKLYSSELTTVQTNALFIEGLNKEPNSVDKTTALQSRLVRFWFPNTYPDDLDFKERMLSDRYVGALLALMVDHYMKRANKAVMLAPTSAALDLQLDHMHTNSLALQFIEWTELTDPNGADALIGLPIRELTARFCSWRIMSNDLAVWEEPGVLNLFRSAVETDRRSVRVNGVPRKLRVVTRFKQETAMFLSRMREVDSEQPVVDD
jgi:phage/plasmid-associated DNA primase